jgi:hypothetical protein
MRHVRAFLSVYFLAAGQTDGRQKLNTCPPRRTLTTKPAFSTVSGFIRNLLAPRACGTQADASCQSQSDLLSGSKIGLIWDTRGSWIALMDEVDLGGSPSESSELPRQPNQRLTHVSRGETTSPSSTFERRTCVYSRYALLRSFSWPSFWDRPGLLDTAFGDMDNPCLTQGRS